jgi:hypothetical protein
MHVGCGLLAVCLGTAAVWFYSTHAPSGNTADSSIPARTPIRSHTVAAEDLCTLLIPPGSMPRPVTLLTFEIVAEKDPNHWTLRKYGEGTGYTLIYHGDKGTGYSAEVEAWIYPTSERASAWLDGDARFYAEVPLEVSGENPYSAFSDRALVWRGWGGNRLSGTIRFTRANVCVTVHVHEKDGAGYDDMLVIARHVGRNIGLAATGKPAPVPFMPGITRESVGSDMDRLRSYQTFAERAWGGDGINIAIADRNGVPWLLPARRLGGDEYLVPLRAVADFLGIGKAANAGGRPAIKLNGKLFIFAAGSRLFTIDGVTHEAESEIGIVDGRVVAPLSLIEYAIEKRLTWTRRDGIPIAHLAE